MTDLGGSETTVVVSNRSCAVQVLAGADRSARASRFATRKNEPSTVCAHGGGVGPGDHHASEQSVG